MHMPTLTKEKYLRPLAEAVATMEGSDAEIVAALNAPTQEGLTYEELDARTVIDTLGAAVYSALEAAAADGSSASAAQCLGYLAYPGSLAVGEGTGGRAAVDALVDEGLLGDADRSALVAAAEQPAMTGPSWAQANGLGTVFHEYIAQARSWQEATE